MKPKLKKLSDQTLVITGASSGIGLVTARMAARRGAAVVVAARAQEALGRLEREIITLGGRVLAVPADVTSDEDLRRVAGKAVERFGGFDTWVNNAAVSIFGEIMQTPLEEERKLFEINYWGMVRGSRIAVEHLRPRGGALINVGSVASDRAIPLQGAYCASKHAIKGYTDTLRMEVEQRGWPISITLIKPTAIDTPLFRNAANHMDAEPVEPSPMYAPEAVAEAILHAAEHPIRDLLVGGTAPLQSFMGRYAPRVGDRVMKAMMFDGQKSQRERLAGEHQVLDRASGDLRERGDYGVKVFERSLFTRAAMHPAITTAVALGAGLAAFGVLWNRR
jgi:NAD(P)-dependent dehydrogenase (short-subunit alcohol dehydrogenase family)